jgi:formamidopyrimidine-DNA glycosylase
MPELPEVQTTVNGINAHVKGFSIRDVWTSYNSAHHAGKDNIKDPKFFEEFKKRVIGAKIVESTRRAKNVLIHLSNGYTVIIHMKMTGHVLYGKYERVFNEEKKKEEWVAVEKGALRDDPFNRHIRLVFTLSNRRHLVLSDLRKFAKVTIVKTSGLATSEHLAASGPEPLDPSFDLKAFKERLAKKPNGPIKQVLMNHEVVAGIGNIYSDEILWRAGIHPLERVKNIPESKIAVTFKAMKETLNKGIDFGGDSMSDYRNIKGEAGEFQDKHNAYRRTGKKCTKPGCKGTIRRIKVGGRSAHFCDEHQRLLSRSSRA